MSFDPTSPKDQYIIDYILKHEKKQERYQRIEGGRLDTWTGEVWLDEWDAPLSYEISTAPTAVLLEMRDLYERSEYLSEVDMARYEATVAELERRGQ